MKLSSEVVGEGARTGCGGEINEDREVASIG